MKLAGRFTSGRAKPSRNCAPTSPRSWTRISPRSASPLKRRSARWRPKRRASHQRKHGPSRGRRLRRRACPMATKFNPATTGSRLHRTEMIGRRLCSSRQAPIFLPTASDDRHNADIQAVAIGGAYGADHYYDDVPGSRWRGGLLVVMAVLALAVLAGTFAYRGMFGGYVFPALPPIVKAGTGPNNIVRNNSDTRRSNSSQTSVTSAGSSEKLQPIDIREAPKTVPRVISTIPISSKPSAGAVALAPAATAPALDPPVASALDQHVAPSVPPPASAPVPVPASSEPNETAAVAPAAREQVAPTPALAPPVLTAASVPPPASAPVPVPASSEPNETAASAAPTPALGPPVLRLHLSRRLPRLRCQYGLGAEARLRWPRRLRLRPLLARRCSRQHLSRRLPRLRCQYRLPRNSKKIQLVVVVQMSGAKQIHRRRPRPPQTPRHPPQQS